MAALLGDAALVSAAATDAEEEAAGAEAAVVAAEEAAEAALTAVEEGVTAPVAPEAVKTRAGLTEVWGIDRSLPLLGGPVNCLLVHAVLIDLQYLAHASQGAPLMGEGSSQHASFCFQHSS
jgi:hypothetical protein